MAFKSVFYFYLFLIATPPRARKKTGESPRARGVSRLIDLRVIYIYYMYIIYIAVVYIIILLSCREAICLYKKVNRPGYYNNII